MSSHMQDFVQKIRLPRIAKHHPVAFSVAVALHLVLFVGLLFSSVQRVEQEPEDRLKKVNSRAIPKAVTVDLSEIKKETQRLLDGQKKKQAKLKREQRRLRELEDKRYQKQRKINKLKAKVKKEKQAKVLAEKKAKEAERKRKIAEKKAKTAEKKKQKIEKQRKAEAKKFKEEQRKRDLTKASQLKAAQKIKDAQKSILDELKVNYITQIASRVNSQWRYSGAKDDWTCEVHIVQDQGGVVKSVKLKSCNVDNKSRETSFKNSIIRAVNKASPLPSAPDKSLFERNIIFNFYQNRSLKK